MSAKIVIVNDKDEVIGAKERSALASSDIYRVSALWIKNSRGDSLLAQRAFDKAHDPGLWGPAVAGTVDEGEDYDINIRKEAAEEIGLNDLKPQLGPKYRIKGDYDYFVQWYTVESDQPASEFSIDPAEVADIRWFSAADLKREMAEHPDKFLKTLWRSVEIFVDNK